MSGELFPYVIRQGDYLVKLAHLHGFDADNVWKDPKNDELRTHRKDHGILAPGDIIYLPKVLKEGLPISKGATNRYTAKVQKVDVTLVFKDIAGAPIADEPYEVKGVGDPVGETKTDGTGKLTLSVPVTVREVTIVFPRKNSAYDVRVGDLDPLSEASGVRQRLANLGHLRESDELDDEEALRAALTEFQRKKSLSPTGELDDPTRQALFHEHQQ